MVILSYLKDQEQELKYSEKQKNQNHQSLFVKVVPTLALQIQIQ